MNLKTRIHDDMKTAMRERNTIKLNAIRLLKADIKNQEISLMRELEDIEVEKIVASSIKKRRDSIEQFQNAGRDELAAKELEEITSIEIYLPEQLDEEDIKKIILEVVASLDESNNKNFGIVMKQVVTKVSGRADGKIVSSLVKGILDGHS